MRTPLLAFIAISVIACGSTDPLAGVRVVATVDRSTVASSDSVRISLSVTNGSRRTVQATSPDSYGFCFHAFRVFDNAEREVLVPTGLCAATTALILVAPQPFDLAPGARVTVVDYWNPAASTLDGAVIPPGVYRLRGVYHVEGRALFSATVQVTVEPSSP